MDELLYKQESYFIIGKCMEVHNYFGHGFAEEIYKEALAIEFRTSNILYQRHKPFEVKYKEQILQQNFIADFVAFDKIILEVKCITNLTDDHFSEMINFLKVSNCRLGLIINFARTKLETKRIIY